MSALTVIMATYHGEAFVEEQLASLEAQDDTSIKLYISDDSYTSGTRDCIERVMQRLTNIDAVYSAGPRKGFVKNFRSAILSCNPKTDYIAFSDQDDVWLADKTARSIKWLARQPKHVPALYCGRTAIIDKDGRNTGHMSPQWSHEPAFQNALVQSLAGGNTMTMNSAGFDLLKRSLAKGTPVSHDWWAYIIISAAGGHIHYDRNPLTLYRQHGDNLIGENRSHVARARRIRMIMKGTWRRWQDINLQLLGANEDLLTVDAQTTIHAYKKVRTAPPIARLTLLKQSGVWRQTKYGTASLFLAALLNKI